ncbi:MAG: hypothetical protein IVW55_01425 [Chloroflexi bacterium]|nr:hypothetical protein [Chloroflexota bacterium]
MTFIISPEATDRARETLKAAQLFSDNRQAIVLACAAAAESEVVLAIVRRDLTFGGTQTLPLRQLREHVLALEPGAWPLLFSPDADANQVEMRCRKMADLAIAKLEAMQRWTSRHS